MVSLAIWSLNEMEFINIILTIFYEFTRLNCSAELYLTLL